MVERTWALANRIKSRSFSDTSYLFAELLSGSTNTRRTHWEFTANDEYCTSAISSPFKQPSTINRQSDSFTLAVYASSEIRALPHGPCWTQDFRVIRPVSAQ